MLFDTNPHLGERIQKLEREHPDKYKILDRKYPEGVPFDKEGYPEFSKCKVYNGRSLESCVKAQVKFKSYKMKGDYRLDFKEANKLAGFPAISRSPLKGYVWHHHQDGQTMLLIPKDLHGAVKHRGGVAEIQSKNLNE